MTHEEFIAEVARRLEWPEERTAGIIQMILEVVSAELKMNNPVAIDDFGSFKTDIQSEWILVDSKTKERYLMPPAMEVVFESLLQENGENSSYPVFFTPDEPLYDEVNSSFSQFEPTLLNEGVQFPGIPEIVAEEEEPDSHPEPVILSEPDLQPEPANDPEPVIPAPIIVPTPEPIIIKSAEPVVVQQSPPERRSRRELKSNKRRSSVWIPIAGGIAIVMASLFFFKGDTNR